jgi:hypothetical protein
VAGADGDFTIPERRFLERLARTLGRELDLDAIGRTVARLWVGEAAPEAEAAAPAPAVAPVVAPAVA